MARIVTFILAISFLGVGVIGSISGGHNHTLFSIFGINFAHNAVHVITGFVALLCFASGKLNLSRGFLWFLTAIYGVVLAAGIIGIDPVVKALNLNTADNILHFAVVALAVLGLVKSSFAHQLQRV